MLLLKSPSTLPPPTKKQRRLPLLLCKVIIPPELVLSFNFCTRAWEENFGFNAYNALTEPNHPHLLPDRRHTNVF